MLTSRSETKNGVVPSVVASPYRPPPYSESCLGPLGPAYWDAAGESDPPAKPVPARIASRAKSATTVSAIANALSICPSLLGGGDDHTLAVRAQDPFNA